MEEVRPGDTFLVEDLLDFSVEGSGWIEEDETGFDEGPVSVAKGPGGSFDSSHGGGSSISGEFSAVFSGEDLCPAQCDELLELEWLSNFVEESFQGDDHQKFLLNPSSQNGRAAHLCVPGKARTKRSRPLHSSWFSYRPVISPITSSSSSSSSSSSPQEAGTPGSSSSPARKVPKAKRKNEPYLQEGRTCLHCAATRTPQWRAGPMGPKTLCNACGVRYKSGKLAPEYRPAASPTFEPSQHSNSHRKVMELRQQKQLSAAHLLSEL